VPVIHSSDLKHLGTKRTKTHEGLGERVTDHRRDHVRVAPRKPAKRQHQALRASSCPPWPRASIRS